MTEFQVVFHLAPDEPTDDEDLNTIAALALEALEAEAPGLALGPVVAVDLDRQSVEVEITVEAKSASEVHQKLGLILAAIERGSRLIVQDSSASRTSAGEPEPVYA
jgi:hypothetical protein